MASLSVRICGTALVLAYVWGSVLSHFQPLHNHASATCALQMQQTASCGDAAAPSSDRCKGAFTVFADGHFGQATGGCPACMVQAMEKKQPEPFYKVTIFAGFLKGKSDPITDPVPCTFTCHLPETRAPPPA